jgi:hypothetical protein
LVAALRRRQLGGGGGGGGWVAALAWRGGGGNGSCLAAAWRQPIGKKNKKIRSFKSYKTISIGKLLWDMRNRSKICANGFFFRKVELVS